MEKVYKIRCLKTLGRVNLNINDINNNNTKYFTCYSYEVVHTSFSKSEVIKDITIGKIYLTTFRAVNEIKSNNAIHIH